MSSVTTKSWRRPAGAETARKSRNIQVRRRLGHVRNLKHTLCTLLREQQTGPVNSAGVPSSSRRSRVQKLLCEARRHLFVGRGFKIQGDNTECELVVQSLLSTPYFLPAPLPVLPLNNEQLPNPQETVHVKQSQRVLLRRYEALNKTQACRRRGS